MGLPRHGGGDAQATITTPTTVPAGLGVTSGLNQQPTRRQPQALTPPMPGDGMMRVFEQDTQHASSGGGPHSPVQLPVVALQNDGGHSGANGVVAWWLLALLASSARSPQVPPLTTPSPLNQQPADQQGQQGVDPKRWWPSSSAAWCANAGAACTNLAGSCLGAWVWQAVQCFGACAVWSGGLIGRRTRQVLRLVETMLLWAVSAR